MNSYELDEIFKILGIEKTKDKKEIKKAYSNLVKTIHPEEKQEEWAKLYDAYKKAILWTDDKNIISRNVYEANKQEQGKKQEPPIKPEPPRQPEKTKQPEPPRQPEKTKQPEQPRQPEQSRNQERQEQASEYEDGITYFKKMELDQKEENRNIEEVVQYLDKISECGKIKYADWKKFFKSKQYKRVCFIEKFIVVFEEKMRQITINAKSRDFILRELDVIWKEWVTLEYFNDESEKTQKESLINWMKYSVKRACQNGEGKKEYAMASIIIFSIIMLFLLIGIIGIEEPLTEQTAMTSVEGIALKNRYLIFREIGIAMNVSIDEVAYAGEMSFLMAQSYSISNHIRVIREDDLDTKDSIQYKIYHEEIPEEIMIAPEDELKERTIIAFSIYSEEWNKEEYGEKMALLSYISPNSNITNFELFVFDGQKNIKLNFTDCGLDQVQSLPFGGYFSNNGVLFFKAKIFEQSDTHPIILVESTTKFST